MKRLLGVFALGIIVSSAMFAAVGGGAMPMAAPEIDLGYAGGALALLSGVLVLVRGRKR